MEGISWDGILGFVGGVITTAVPWLITKYKDDRPLKNAIDLYKSNLSKGLDSLLKTSFLSHSNNRIMVEELYPPKILKKLIKDTDNILQDFIPFLSKRNKKILLDIEKDLTQLKEGMDVFWMKRDLLINPTPETSYPVNKEYSFLNQIKKTKSHLKKLK